MSSPNAPHTSLADAILEPLDRLIYDYATADDLIAQLLERLNEISSAFAIRSRSSTPQGSVGEAESAPQAHGPVVDANDGDPYAAVLDLQEQLSLLEGVASVRASVPADGVPTLVVELIASEPRPGTE